MQVKKRAILGQLSDADMRLLRVFKSVVDCGGMAAAELELDRLVHVLRRVASWNSISAFRPSASM